MTMLSSGDLVLVVRQFWATGARWVFPGELALVVTAQVWVGFNAVEYVQIHVLASELAFGSMTFVRHELSKYVRRLQ